MIQDFLSHGISIPIGSSNKFTKKLVKMLHQNCNRCALVIPAWYINKFTIIDFTIQYGYIIEATISYYPFQYGPVIKLPLHISQCHMVNHMALTNAQRLQF